MGFPWENQMAHLSTNTHIPFLSSVAASITAAVRSFVEAKERVTEYKRLDSRSDDELARMGLTRGKILSYVMRDEPRR